MSLPEAAAYLGRITGQKPHVSTLWRWCLKGCKGVRLESICLGGKRLVGVSENDTVRWPKAELLRLVTRRRIEPQEAFSHSLSTEEFPVIPSALDLSDNHRGQLPEYPQDGVVNQLGIPWQVYHIVQAGDRPIKHLAQASRLTLLCLALYL